jgi:hypothetical protein
MKVFFYHLGTPTPVFETELELIRIHEKRGDLIRVLQCTGEIPNCHWNWEHSNLACARCRSRFRNGWSVLNPGKNVELKKFPANKGAPPHLPHEFTSVDSLKQYQYDNENIGMGVASSLISIFRDHRFDTQKYRKEVLRELSSAVFVYETLKREFEEFRPDRVYIFNGRITAHLPAAVLCKRMGIEYFEHEVGQTLNRYLLRKNSSTHGIPAMREEIEMLWSKGGREREKVAREFFEQKRTGMDHELLPSFTKYQKQSLLPEGFSRDRKNIAIFNSTIDEYAAVEGWENLIYEPDETAGIHKILESFESDGRFMFYLRVHPNMKEVADTTSQLRDIRDLSSRFGNLRVIWPMDRVDSYALLDACEKTVSFGSTIGIEAAYWGRPSILAGHAAYEHLDCVYTPKTHTELVMLLKRDLPPLPANSALKYGFRQMGHGTPFKYFMQTGLSSGTFDGVEIKPAALPDLLFFLWRIMRLLTKPSKIIRKLRSYARARHLRQSRTSNK